jgi:hypothetical protein
VDVGSTSNLSRTGIVQVVSSLRLRAVLTRRISIAISEKLEFLLLSLCTRARSPILVSDASHDVP